MTNIVTSKTQALLEFLVVVFLAGIVTFGPGLVGTVIPADNPLAPAIPYIVMAATFIAYEFLSPEGLALFKEMMATISSKPDKKNDEGGIILDIALAIGGLLVLGLILAYVFKIERGHPFKE